MARCARIDLWGIWWHLKLFNTSYPPYFSQCWVKDSQINRKQYTVCISGYWKHHKYILPSLLQRSKECRGHYSLRNTTLRPNGLWEVIHTSPFFEMWRIPWIWNLEVCRLHVDFMSLNKCRPCMSTESSLSAFEGYILEYYNKQRQNHVKVH